MVALGTILFSIASIARQKCLTWPTKLKQPVNSSVQMWLNMGSKVRVLECSKPTMVSQRSLVSLF